MALKRALGGSEMNLDTRALGWGIAAVIHTLSTAYGLYYIILARHNLAVRLRGLFWILSSVIVLYSYGILILLAYIINGHYPCGVEFWVMNTLLPYGMALFQSMIYLELFGNLMANNYQWPMLAFTTNIPASRRYSNLIIHSAQVCRKRFVPPTSYACGKYSSRSSSSA